MIHSTRLIVLGVTKVGEKSVVLHTLSPDFGRRSFITSAGKSSPMALFLPLNILDAEVQENPKSDLWRLKSVSAAYPLFGIRGNVAKNAMTMFMSEVLYRTVTEGAYEEGLFEWCEKCILTLDALESDFANYHIRFLLELCAALGFRPELGDLAPFAGDHLASLRDFLSMDFASSMLIPLNGHTRNEIAELLLRYISVHTESRLDVQSLKVLSELFRQ